MGHIKEPKGVDFVIASEPLTETARLEISAFIKAYKAKEKAKAKKPARKDKKNKLVTG